MGEEKIKRMKFLGKEMKSKLDFVLSTAGDGFETYKEQGLIRFTREITFNEIIQLAQLITLLDISEKLDKLNK